MGNMGYVRVTPSEGAGFPLEEVEKLPAFLTGKQLLEWEQKFLGLEQRFLALERHVFELEKQVLERERAQLVDRLRDQEAARQRLEKQLSDLAQFYEALSVRLGQAEKRVAEADERARHRWQPDWYRRWRKL